jgi:hypothetical protein
MNGQPLKIVGRPAEGYVVVVPERASSDVIEWESFGVRRKSRFRFEVIDPPAVTGLEPTSGPPGTRVTLHGKHLLPNARVSLGGVGVVLIERSATRIVVTVPQTAVSNVFEVQSGGAALRSPLFTVTKPPAR